MIQPVNNHLIIEPLKHESFISQEKGTYEEVGVVVNAANGILKVKRPTLVAGIWEDLEDGFVEKGDMVFFDSWLAARYPTGKGEEFFWLVNWNDVRAIEHEDKVSE